jgi:hypothetical protein
MMPVAAVQWPDTVTPPVSLSESEGCVTHVGTFKGVVAPIRHLLAVQDTPFPISDLVEYHVMRDKRVLLTAKPGNPALTSVPTLLTEPGMPAHREVLVLPPNGCCS